VLSVAATQPKVDFELEVGHVPVESHSDFDGNKSVDFGSQPDVGHNPKSTQTMSTTPPNTTLLLPETTPIKVDSKTTLPFTTHDKYRIETCTAMAAEIKKYLVGPMPVQQFLDQFFPIRELPGVDKLPEFEPGIYNSVLKAKLESDAYDPFVSLN
jgi:hypothetical protein